MDRILANIWYKGSTRYVYVMGNPRVDRLYVSFRMDFLANPLTTRK